MKERRNRPDNRTLLRLLFSLNSRYTESRQSNLYALHVIFIFGIFYILQNKIKNISFIRIILGNVHA